MEVDVVVIGSGIAALAALGMARACGKTAVAVDASYRDGGYLQTLNSAIPMPKAPLFIDENDVQLLSSVGVGIECLEVELKVVKDGDYSSKVAGFSDLEVQRNWFAWWAGSKRLCLGLDLFDSLKHAFGFSKGVPIHMISNVRKIDVIRNTIALAHGGIVRYRRLIYTWPITLLPRLIYPNSKRYVIEKLIKDSGIDFASIYVLTALLPEKDGYNTIRIYVHATKASKMHTAIAIPTKGASILYAITSYSKKYPLAPGINEKLLSELRKHRIATPKEMASRYSLNITYGLMGKTSRDLDTLKQYLEDLNIYLFGRVAQWKEQTVGEILRETEAQKIIT